MVLAKSFARIHWQNVANFGILALEFTDPADYDRVEAGDTLTVTGLHDTLRTGSEPTVHNATKNHDYAARHRLSERRREAVLAGGRIPLLLHEGET